MDLPSVASAVPSFEGKLVLAFGRAETKAGVKDPVFPGVAVKGLALRRSVEFYQTVEHDESDGAKKSDETSGTSYLYASEWVSSPVTGSFANRPSKNMVLMKVDYGMPASRIQPVKHSDWRNPKFLSPLLFLTVAPKRSSA